VIFNEGVGHTICRGDAGGTAKVTFIDDGSAEVGVIVTVNGEVTKGHGGARDMEVAKARRGGV
jgi:hypothetical protein